METVKEFTTKWDDVRAMHDDAVKAFEFLVKYNETILAALDEEKKNSSGMSGPGLAEGVIAAKSATLALDELKWSLPLY